MDKSFELTSTGNPEPLVTVKPMYFLESVVSAGSDEKIILWFFLLFKPNEGEGDGFGVSLEDGGRSPDHT